MRMISTYKNLGLPLKIISLLIFAGLTAGTEFLRHKAPENLIFDFFIFIFILCTLLLVFNLGEFKVYTRVFLGLGLGLLTGVFAPDTVSSFYPVGQVFIRLIKMIVVPLVFASLLVGTASLGDIRKLGRIGVKTITFYLLSTALAITIGLAIANLIKPGEEIPAQVKTEISRDYESSARDQVESAGKDLSPVDILLDIIPENPVRAMSEGKMLQIILFALLCGIALTHIPAEKREPLIRFFDAVTEVMIMMVHFIMRLAPYGVFALIAYVIASYGSSIILTLFSYFFTTILALIIHVILFNSAVIKYFSGLTIREFWQGIYPVLLVAFSTSSSSATLPVTMDCAENNLKVRPDVASFVLPLGSTINMDGTAIFQGVSAVFIANVYGIDLTIIDQLTIILTATLASIGTAGAPQVGIIMLTLVLQSIGIPLEGIALILGVERFLDMTRTMVNVTSDLSCSVFISDREAGLAIDSVKAE